MKCLVQRLYTSDWQLIEHYVFPSISRGKVMTVVPADGAGKPNAGGGGGGGDAGGEAEPNSRC